MEGRDERRGVPAESKEEEGTEKFGYIEKASAELTGKVSSDLEMEGIPPESRLKISAFGKREIAASLENLGVAEILKMAAERGWKLAIYNPGVAWTGDQWAKREVRDNPRFGKSLLSLSSEVVEKGISREEKVEEQKKSAALDFLAEADYDLCLTLDPVEARGFVSSLRADMIARRFLMQTIDQVLGEKAKSILTSVNWSNGAFKEGQLHKAVFEAVAKETLGDDTGDDLGVFRNGDEAVSFGALYGKLGIDVYLGGGPTDEQELATPFKLTSEVPLVRMINEKGLGLVNWLIKKARSLPAKYLPEKNRLLATRVLEMGRGKRVEEVEVGDALSQIQTIMIGLIGEARLVTLADTSGSVVDSSRQMLGDDLKVVYGEKTIMIETHQEKPLPRLPEEKGFPAYSPAQHGELKRYGVLANLKRIVKEMREGTFNQAGNEQERNVVVQTGAREYGQKKGTKLRLNPLPKLGGEVTR